MKPDRTAALEALLAQTEAAHGAFEVTELNGVYDEAWPRWYAEYAIDHGIGELLGRPVTVDELARFFATSWAASEATGRNESWSAYTARRIATGL